MRSWPAPLKVPGFGRLLASYGVNEVGDSVALVALSVLVYERTGDAMAMTAFFLAAKFLPALLAPLLTARVDQLAVGRVLPALYVLEALTFVALALVVDNFSLPLVLALGLVDGTLALAGRGLSRGASAALLTPGGQLRDGNALLNIAFGAASVIGLAAGGVIVSAASVQTALVVDAASFVVIALLLATSRSLPASVPRERREDFRVRVRAGFSYAREVPAVRWVLVFQAIALLFFTVVLPIEVVYAKETLNTGDAGFGALVATWSAGILVGSLLYLRARSASLLLLVLGSSAAIGVAYLGMSLSRELVLACLFSAFGGIGNGFQWVSVMTMLQEATPVGLQARIAGLLESVAAAVPGLGFLVGGILTTATSPPAAYATAGAGTLVLVAGGALAFRGVASSPAWPAAPEPAPEPPAVTLNGRAGRWVTRALLVAAVLEAVSVTTGRGRRR